MIGVFDSGVGGLTVLRELRKVMPQADFVYFGDTKNAPYGPRPHYELVELTVAAMQFLLLQGATGIVSACNSVSAAMALTDTGTFPCSEDRLIEMVGPTVDMLSDSPGRILLCATEATIRAGIYQDGFAARGKEIDAVPVPELAGLIEADASASDVRGCVEAALTPCAGSYDMLVLGCTHYPLVIDTFRDVAGSAVRVFDPAAAVAAATAARFPDEQAGQGAIRFLISKDSLVFRRLVADMFPHSRTTVEVIE